MGFGSSSGAGVGIGNPSTQSGSAFRTTVLSALTCDPGMATVFAVQPSVHASDLAGERSPLMRKLVSDAKTKMVVPYGHGDVDVAEMARQVAEKCDVREESIERIAGATMTHPVYDDDDNIQGASGERQSRIIIVDLPTLPVSHDERQMTIGDNEHFLNSLLKSLPRREYNLIYVSTPAPAAPGSYRRSHPSLNAGSPLLAEKKAKNGTATGGLFSRYQYFTPGIFMGYMAMLILVPVLIVGLQALNSLQISYRAFDPPLKVGPKQG